MPAKKNKIQTVRQGDIAAVTFWDHMAGGPAELFTVYGLCVGITRHEIHLMSCGYADKKVRGDSNETEFSIVRSTITEQRRLR